MRWPLPWWAPIPVGLTLLVAAIAAVAFSMPPAPTPHHTYTDVAIPGGVVSWTTDLSAFFCNGVDATWSASQNTTLTESFEVDSLVNTGSNVEYERSGTGGAFSMVPALNGQYLIVATNLNASLPDSVTLALTGTGC